MATSVHSSEKEPVQVQAMVEFLTKLDGDSKGEKMADYKALVEKNQVTACLSKLATEYDLLFAKASDSEIVSFFSLYFTLLMKGGKEVVGDLLPKLFQQVTSSTERKQIRLQVMADLFNLDANATHRFSCLNSIFAYAASSDQIDSINHLITNLDEWIYELKLEPVQVRKLMGSVLPGFQNSPESRDFVVRFLNTFAEGETLGEYEAVIEKLLVEFVKAGNSEATQLDEILLDCPVISSLSSKPVFKLLEIFANGSCKDFSDFASNNSGFFADTGISVDASRHALSMAAFARLCASKRTVTYGEVTAALGIKEDEVDSVVIDAITQGLVDARINQPEKTILVRYAKQRNYGPKEWEQLGQRVDTFKSNILELITVLEATKREAHK